MHSMFLIFILTFYLLINIIHIINHNQKIFSFGLQLIYGVVSLTVAFLLVSSIVSVVNNATIDGLTTIQRLSYYKHDYEFNVALRQLSVEFTELSGDNTRDKLISFQQDELEKTLINIKAQYEKDYSLVYKMNCDMPWLPLAKCELVKLFPSSLN